MPIFWIRTIQAVYSPAGFSGSSSIASGRSDQGIRKAVEAPIPIRQIMKIKIMNKIIFPEFRNKSSPTPETLDKEGLNIIEQCYSAQLTIRLCIGFIPSILVIIGLLIMRKWDQKLITN